ncbi:cytochrome c-type biogenesis protein [Limibacillus halophilus]|uniref:Cytochrome c-type biogenesis protein n=1 Tax=Limibacillus halophilus TaxID=1579333 RepID=A0A839SZR1_9PROT|nr:cytochrome c-type biogenesis protein [Limibacillus halophilus]MBB3066383.1 cytochrome c-type biogenesis protein CcmH [Limibacillus halophilus]
MKGVALALLLITASISGAAFAVEPGEMLSDPQQEARAREISKSIRCVVCQNQDIDSSNADLARDLRIMIRERIVSGDSNGQVRDFLVARYGDYVLLRPPVKPSTYVLWFGPLVLLLLGGLSVWVYLRGHRPVASACAPLPLSDEERRRVDQILGRGEKD